MDQLKTQGQTVQKELQDAQWLLGEEKTKREQFEAGLKDSVARCQDLEAQLDLLRAQGQSAQKDLQEAQWLLGEEKGRREQVESELKIAIANGDGLQARFVQLQAQCDEAQKELEEARVKKSKSGIAGKLGKKIVHTFENLP